MRRVAVGLTAVPQHLGQADLHLPVDLVRVVGVADRRVPVVVDAPVEQGAVVHARHAEHGARPLLGDRGDRATEDAALAVAVVGDVAGFEGGVRGGADLEGGRAGEASSHGQGAR